MTALRPPSFYGPLTDAKDGSDVMAGRAFAAEPADVYRNFMDACAIGADGFDAHVLASVLAISARAGRRCDAAYSGSRPDRRAIRRARAGLLPEGCRLEALCSRCGRRRAADEACLLDLLETCTTSQTPFERLLASMIAKRAQQPNHLWQIRASRSRRAKRADEEAFQAARHAQFRRHEVEEISLQDDLRQRELHAVHRAKA